MSKVITFSPCKTTRVRAKDLMVGDLFLWLAEPHNNVWHYERVVRLDRTRPRRVEITLGATETRREFTISSGLNAVYAIVPELSAIRSTN